MCKGGSKTVNTSQQQYAISDQGQAGIESYSANPLAYDAAEQAMGRSRELASTPYGVPTRAIAGFNADQEGAAANINKAQGMAQPYIDKGAGYTDEAAGYSRAAAAPVSMGPLDINSYLNPYAQYSLAGLNQTFGAQNKAMQGSNAQMMGGVGGDRAGVTEGMKFGQDQLARGQLMSSFYQPAVTAAQQQQWAKYAADVGNRDASGRTAAQLAGFGGQYAGFGSAAQSAALQGAQAQFGAGAARQGTTQAQLDASYQQALQQIEAPYKQNQYLMQSVAGLAPVIGGTKASASEMHGTQSSSGSGTQVTETQQSPLSSLLGLGMMGLGLATGNPMAAFSGMGNLFGGASGGGGEYGPAGQGGYAPQGQDSAGNWNYSQRGGRITEKAEGGAVNPYDVGRGYDAGGLIFDPNLSDELYPNGPTDRNSQEFNDLAFNPYAQKLEGETDQVQPDPESIPQRDYIERVNSGDAPDFRDALMRHGQSVLAAPGNENLANRLTMGGNRFTDPVGSAAQPQMAQLPERSPLPSYDPRKTAAGMVSFKTAVGSGGNPYQPALALDATPNAEPPPGAPRTPVVTRPTGSSRMTLEQTRDEILRRQLEQKPPQDLEVPPVPSLRRRAPEQRSWWGPDGRLTELGLRLLMATGDRDKNGVPVGFGANLGTAGVGTLDNERKLREEARKAADTSIEDEKSLDAMKLNRLKIQDLNLNRRQAHDDRQLGIVTKSMDAEEERNRRKERDAWEERYRMGTLNQRQVEAFEKANLARERYESGNWTYKAGTSHDADGNVVNGIIATNKNGSGQPKFYTGSQYASVLGSGGKTGVRQWMYQEYLKERPEDKEGALRILTGEKRVSDADIARIAASRARTVISAQAASGVAVRDAAATEARLVKEYQDQMRRDRDGGSAAPSSTPPPAPADETKIGRIRNALEAQKKAGNKPPTDKWFKDVGVDKKDIEDILKDWK